MEKMKQIKAEEAEPTFTESGMVANCLKLNVRTAPHLKADVAEVVDSGTEVLIDFTGNGSANWYHVRTPSGIEGFAMSKYISINTTG